MKVRLNIFEGPLDLLLYLIKKNHLNIYDIPLVKVVEQYLHFLELMKLLDINIASEYLVMAADLINIKSKMLLPQEEISPEEPEVDPREELVRRLLEYEKFKEAADFLKAKEAERLQVFSRPPLKGEEGEVYLEASIFDLISAFKNALAEVPREIFLEVIKDEFTVEEKMHDLLHLILERGKISLEELFMNAKSKLEIVVVFLSILELIRLREVVAIQEELFGSILIIRKGYVYSSYSL